MTGCYSCHTQLDGVESDLPATYDEIFEAALERTHNYWRFKKIWK